MRLNRSNSERRLLTVLALIWLTGVSAPAMAQSPAARDKDLAKAIDEVLLKTFKPNEPGAAVIVVKDGKAIFRKGYGLANLELGAPIEPDMVFRLGSITKQFTAVSILMLAEQGKLSLDDEITRFLPDYPTKGQRITIEHLLTHTSGIKSYTSLPEWLSVWRKDMSVKEIIDLFKDKPMDFAPGERWSYNNSGYILLGAIIEKVSGQAYQEFIEKNIFAPLGMKHSYYDVTARIIPRRVAGYSKGRDGFKNAAYLSMTQPYAAGSLMSSVDDLALWDEALYTEKLVKQQSLKRAWTSYVLKSGKPTKYGFGWMMSSLEGHRTIEHGGGVNGFVTDGIRLPDDHVFVAVLTNREAGMEEVSRKIAALAVGETYHEPVAIKLAASALDKYVAVYQLNEKEDYVVLKENEKLLLQHPLAGRVELLPVSDTEFFLKEFPSMRILFVKNPAGNITGLVVRTNIGPDEELKRTDKPLPAPAKEAAVDPAVYDGYVGEYELAPGFTITIGKEGDKLMAQATGQPKIELRPESQTKFFIKEVGAQVEFVVDQSGKASSMVLHQGGQTLPAKRIK